jgi:hypothetical protein
MRHDHVIAAITLVPVSAFRYRHQLEVALLNAIWTPPFIGRPRGEEVNETGVVTRIKL